ncbi:MAG: HAMP domain-containing histidine kinase [Deltaproteobacteria bacterium]|nr:HAMP domain-containing histidine kinase [Deltaproteobacteria bacterium]
MRLARKITLAIAAAIVAVMATHAYLLLQRQVVLFDADLQRGLRLKQALRASIDGVWRTYGPEAAEHLVERTISEAVDGVHIRWTWLAATDETDPRFLALPPADKAQLAQGERVIHVRENAQGVPQRYTYIPETLGADSPIAVLEFVESIGEQHEYVQANRWQILLATGGILLACTTAVYALGVWYVGRPVQRLRDRLRAIAAGDLDSPLRIEQNDEIGDLAREIDGMCRKLAEARRQLTSETEARLQALDQLRHTDRLTTIGQLAAGVAHELGTPLSVIGGRAEMIADGEATGERAAASARVIVDQSRHMAEMIRELLDFSRQRGPRFGLTSVRAVCARTIDTLAPIARRRQVEVASALADDPLVVSADEHQLEQALVNLIVNAVQATTGGGRIEVTCAGRRARPPGDGGPDGDFACVTVADHGAGIRSEHLSRIFEPFFTTKAPGEGTGLGLAVAHGIIRDHGGWIEVESRPGEGSLFTFYLPAAAAAEHPPHRAA